MSRRLKRQAGARTGQSGLGWDQSGARFSAGRSFLGNRAAVRPRECSQLSLGVLGSARVLPGSAGAASHCSLSRVSPSLCGLQSCHLPHNSGLLGQKGGASDRPTPLRCARAGCGCLGTWGTAPTPLWGMLEAKD